MNASFRLLAAVCVLIVAAAGCQKGKERGEEAEAKAGGAVRGTGSASAADDAGKAAGDSRTGGSVSTLTTVDDGKALDLRQGQVLTVVLDSNRTAGFSWVMADPTGTAIVRDGSPVYVAKSGKRGIVGSGGTETWRFRAVRPGRQTVRLEYGRPWTRNVPERTFRFTATVR